MLFVQPSGRGLAVHVFDDDVVDFAEGHHVLEDFIRFVRMEVIDELSSPTRSSPSKWERMYLMSSSSRSSLKEKLEVITGSIIGKVFR